MLAMQASLVASKQALGKNCYWRPWVFVSKRQFENISFFKRLNQCRMKEYWPNLSHQAKIKIDDALGENNDDYMEAMDKKNQIQVLDHVFKKLIAKFLKAYFEN